MGGQCAGTRSNCHPCSECENQGFFLPPLVRIKLRYEELNGQTLIVTFISAKLPRWLSKSLTKEITNRRD